MRRADGLKGGWFVERWLRCRGVFCSDFTSRGKNIDLYPGTHVLIFVGCLSWVTFEDVCVLFFVNDILSYCKEVQWVHTIAGLSCFNGGLKTY